MGKTPWVAARARSCSTSGTGLDSPPVPIYEYQCEKCEERYEEFLHTSTNPAPPCPKCGSEDVKRLMSRINTEWQPSDVDWDQVGKKWD